MLENEGHWSQDRQWFWDGTKWTSAVSEAGDRIYDGSSWIPFFGERSEAPAQPGIAAGADHGLVVRDPTGETEGDVPTSLALGSAVTFSPDGQWWWSDGQWLATHLTEDGHHWWNGTEWLPFTGVNGASTSGGSDVAVHPPVSKDALKKAREAYKQAEKDYRDAVKQAETELKIAQESHSKAVQSSQKQLADAEGSYRKAVQNAQQVFQSWSNPGHGRRLATYQGITLYEHAIATPQGTAPILGASASVDTAGNLAVTKRVTLTRLVAGGIIGGLIFQKKSKDDTRELYIVIETPTIVTAVKCPPDQGMRARQLAANIQQQANWAANWIRQRETALPQAEAWLSHVTADTAAWQAAWVELARVQGDPAYVLAVDEARKRLSETRRDFAAIEAARGGLTAIGEAPPPLALPSGPPMEPLNSKEEEVLKGLVASDEEILAAVVGNGGQAVVVTSEKVVVIKLNFAAGANKGHQAWRYEDLVAVQVRTSLGNGVIEFGTSAQPVKGIGSMQAQGSTNAVAFGGKDEAKFRELEALVADQIREKRFRVQALEAASIPELPLPPDPEPSEVEPSLDPEVSSGAGGGSVALGADEAPSTSPGTAIMPDKYAQLKVLGELRDQGILTETEFQIEKAKILDQG